MLVSPSFIIKRLFNKDDIIPPLWSVTKKVLSVYDKAGIAVSEKELLEFLQNRSKKWRMPRKHGE